MKQRSNTAVKKKSAAPAQKPNFFVDIFNEMKKVTWLSRRELMYLTGLVILFTVVMALILGVIDFGFSKLVNGVFIGGG